MLLDYATIKKLFADKFASDDFESAFYHTIKHVYEQGVKDGSERIVLQKSPQILQIAHQFVQKTENP